MASKGVFNEGGQKALVVEGGGASIFAAGVLDEFLQEKFNPFDLFIGVSAGAVTLASYLAGQYGDTTGSATGQ